MGGYHRLSFHTENTPIWVGVKPHSERDRETMSSDVTLAQKRPRDWPWHLGLPTACSAGDQIALSFDYKAWDLQILEKATFPA